MTTLAGRARITSDSSRRCPWSGVEGGNLGVRSSFVAALIIAAVGLVHRRVRPLRSGRRTNRATRRSAARCSSAATTSFPPLPTSPSLRSRRSHWWAMAGLYHTVRGVGRHRAEGPRARIAGFLALLLVFDLGRRVSNPFGGLMSVIAVSTMSGFFYNFHRVVVDPFLALFILIGYWGFVVAAFGKHLEDEEPTRTSILGDLPDLCGRGAGLPGQRSGRAGPPLRADCGGRHFGQALGPLSLSRALGRHGGLHRPVRGLAGDAV